MPRSVVVVSSDRDVFDRVRDVLGSDRRFIVDADQVHCDGLAAPLTNIYPIVTDAEEWADWNTSVGPMPDPRTSTMLIFETRSAAWVAEVGRLLAKELMTPVWFVDSSDTAWPAAAVDPELLSLG